MSLTHHVETFGAHMQEGDSLTWHWPSVTCDRCIELHNHPPRPAKQARVNWFGPREALRKLGEGASGTRPPTEEEWRRRVEDAVVELEQAHNDAVAELGGLHNDVVDRIHEIQEAVDTMAIAVGALGRVVELLQTRGLRATVKRAAEAAWLMWSWLREKPEDEEPLPPRADPR